MKEVAVGTVRSAPTDAVGEIIHVKPVKPAVMNADDKDIMLGRSFARNRHQKGRTEGEHRPPHGDVETSKAGRAIEGIQPRFSHSEDYYSEDYEGESSTSSISHVSSAISTIPNPNQSFQAQSSVHDRVQRSKLAPKSSPVQSSGNDHVQRSLAPNPTLMAKSMSWRLVSIGPRDHVMK